MAVMVVPGPVRGAAVTVVATGVVPRGRGCSLLLLAVLAARGPAEAAVAARGCRGRRLGSGRLGRGRRVAAPLLARFSEIDLLDAARRGEAVLAPVGLVALVRAQRAEVVGPGAGAPVAVAVRELEERLGRRRRRLAHRALGRVQLGRLRHQDRLRVRHLLLGQQLGLGRQAAARREGGHETALELHFAGVWLGAWNWSCAGCGTDRPRSARYRARVTGNLRRGRGSFG